MKCPDRSDKVRTENCSLNFISTYFLAKSVLHLSTLLLIILISIKHTLLTSIKSFFNLTPTSHSNSLFSFFFQKNLSKELMKLLSLCLHFLFPLQSIPIWFLSLLNQLWRVELFYSWTGKVQCFSLGIPRYFS